MFSFHIHEWEVFQIIRMHHEFGNDLTYILKCKKCGKLRKSITV